MDYSLIFYLTNVPVPVFGMNYVKFNRITHLTHQARIINCSFPNNLWCKDFLLFSFQGTESLCIFYLVWSYRILKINPSAIAIKTITKQVLKSRFIIFLNLYRCQITRVNLYLLSRKCSHNPYRFQNRVQTLLLIFWQS